MKCIGATLTVVSFAAVVLVSLNALKIHYQWHKVSGGIFFQRCWIMRLEYVIEIPCLKGKQNGAKSNVAKLNLIRRMQFKQVKHFTLNVWSRGKQLALFSRES